MSVTNGSFDCYTDSESGRQFYRGKLFSDREGFARGLFFRDSGGSGHFTPISDVRFLGYLPAKTQEGIPEDFTKILREISSSGADAFFGWSSDGIDTERYILMKLDNDV